MRALYAFCASPIRRTIVTCPEPPQRHTPAHRPHGTPQPARAGLAGVAAMLGSGLSNQPGAAIGSLAFPVLGPVGVVAVRQ